ncbi:neuronal acetylcholine receptor subunit alpha-7-like [Mercenaria mercenaria]|uniref:neuronal acetylcholine receptor subunit alpha-7-like n=1 Tax=Mercenaria mercenaria TaxID=6596 RepID=UPI00234EE63A|nr:neuronal acetylcholine receptor subunit alpha-7-like [Mercenaria mercenaria]
MTTLKKMLLTGYDKDVVAVLNQSHVLNVTVIFSLLAIPEVDTVGSTIKLSAYLNLAWTDEKLTWDPADYGGIQELSLLVDTVWTPPIILGNGVTTKTIANSWHKVLINHTGVSRVALRGTFNGLCGFTMTFWPFDKQACNLFFVPLGNENIRFIFPSNPIHDDDFIPMGEWTYEQITASYQNRFYTGNDIIYTVKISRHSAFYLLTMIIPLYCVTSLGLFVLLIPCDTGERVGFGITIMLSMVVFMMVIKDEVPKTSEPLPYMCIYINITVFAAFIVNIINFVSLSLFHRNEAQPVGQRYKYLVNLVSMFSGNRTVHPEVKARKNKDDNITCLPSTPEKQLDNVLPSMRKENLEPVEHDFISEPTVKHDKIVTWKDVSNAIDRITFVTLTPLAILATIAGVVYLKAASVYPDWAN